MLKTKDWELVYTPNRDGISVGTFYEKTKNWKITLLVV